MREDWVLRPADPSDSEGILKIYAPFILESPATFECEVPSVSFFAERINTYTQDLPWLVCEEKGIIAGYAYASKHRARKSYQWSVESSVYLLPEYQGRGIARTLYSTLFSLLKLQGIVNVYAGITLPNERSEAFHTTMGFSPIGIYKNIGYKLGKWHDVKWMSLTVGNHGGNPADPIPVTALFGTPEFEKILEAGNRGLEGVV